MNTKGRFEGKNIHKEKHKRRVELEKKRKSPTHFLEKYLVDYDMPTPERTHCFIESLPCHSPSPHHFDPAH